MHLYNAVTLRRGKRIKRGSELVKPCFNLSAEKAKVLPNGKKMSPSLLNSAKIFHRLISSRNSKGAPREKVMK